MDRITTEQKLAFAKMLNTNQEVFDSIMQDMEYSLFKQFIIADDKQREVIGNILNAGELFKAELNLILNNSIENPNA